MRGWTTTHTLLLVSGLVVLGIALFAAVVLGSQGVSRAYEDASDIVMFPGRIALPTNDSTAPRVMLQAHWAATATASEVFLNATDATLVVPTGTRASGIITFLNGTVGPRAICDTFSGLTNAVYKSWFTAAAATTVVVDPAVRLPVMGCSQLKRADGTYVSPFIDMITRHGYTGWTIMERDWRVGVMPGVVRVPCLQWHWTDLLPEPSGQYIIALRPTAVAPWTTALLDFGAYFSTLPGLTSNSATVTIVTSAGISLFANASFYMTSQPASSQCVLGVAALAWFSAAALDLQAQRLGLLFTRIGNVETNSSPFVFT